MNTPLLFFAIVCGVGSLSSVSARGGIPDDLRKDIEGHRENVDKIMKYILEGAGKHMAYNRIAYIADRWGNRYTGSEALENVIDYVKEHLINETMDSVTTEEFKADQWVRGEDTVTLQLPRELPMSVLALGGSVGTPPGGITADVIVVKTFQELEDRKDEVTDKIVVFNMAWEGYSTTVKYRTTGATEASKRGALAMLLRSVTDFSLYTPHTGQQQYNETYPKIPALAITVEDTELLQRMHDRNDRIRILLKVGSQRENEQVTTRNIIAQLNGTKYPDQSVTFGGHIDSWDVGSGVMDDGGGVAISWQVLSTMKALGLKAKRTMRSVFWSAEEIGLVGAKAYHARHKEDNKKMSLIMESDYGTFPPLGVGFTGSGLARATIKAILEEFLKPLNATQVGPDGSEPDTGMWVEEGVPGVGLISSNEHYFWYHHTEADSITMQDPDVLDRCAAVWTVVAYVVANLEDMLDREKDVINHVNQAPLAATVPFMAGLLMMAFLALKASRL